MFTLEQLNEIHDRLGTIEDFSQYVRALQLLGVEKYDSYLADGHSEFFSKEGYKVVSPSVHDMLQISDISDREKAQEHLDLHNQGKTSYLEMSKGLADSGIEKWTVDTSSMTFACYDKQGNILLTEDVDSN
ncbi:DUF1398 domain-containing protein [Ktedonospora formicarum]|uniref:DUF1398 domain-containing protein n=1 Tax=Ktedonospora formicarum TaxID=2778364 RepID=A0A8J3HZ23_9CHLR|nr:DUF1398 family protein [Ktedonospora formicarum]GHO46379.1 hypothetical protein KSX_45420 [Ktedonospora formicarum]